MRLEVFLLLVFANLKKGRQAVTRSSFSVLIFSTLMLACSGSSTDPGNGPLTEKATDPSGDTYGTQPVQWDLTALTLTRDTGGITFAIDFTSNVLSGVTGDSDAVYGEIDFDTDQSITTGTTSYVDVFGPGSSGMGVDYVVDLFDYTPDSLVPVLRYNANDSTYSTVYSLRPTFSGKRISGRIPLSALGNDDGFLNAAVIVGTLAEATDIAPNSGHLKVGGTGPVPPITGEVAAQGIRDAKTSRETPSRRAAAWTSRE